ncbi:urease accessory protein UreD [Methylicorpusculum sp.]|uniref:urease accessory protein UreD n=1 Tax=Methylicorpusculum sp. TaxID=2713644 RepID=UPI00271DB80A|nr:urease accessory protein UreD [Methylicorpusculum sp.]MDO8846734.1 urease accessory protein UreD [Methylicorpusculum sp.]MDP2179161.1 urease accessory protein UreD [Methylicorpusculum sp.]MDP3531372.1 urease accessory protein UreD [Methylicorpusculum sp.]MDZ4150634.1 urease accessory protein UreD [Methylicorpusculum sp.]
MFDSGCASGGPVTSSNKHLSGSGWQAELELVFERTNDRTVLTGRKYKGPLTVQRPFYPEGDACHVYVLHPPGGVVAGDRLTIDVDVRADSHALITTPAAGKFYRSEGDFARQAFNLSVAKGACLEWLPQETIIYEGARLSSGIAINLEPGAKVIAWEINVLGRPAAREAFTSGEADLQWRIFRDHQPFFLERSRLDAKAFAARWGLNGQSACGIMVAGPVSAQALADVQELIGDAPDRGVTRIDDMLICRALDARADLLRLFFNRVWALIRPDVTGKSVCSPRIWAT